MKSRGSFLVANLVAALLLSACAPAAAPTPAPPKPTTPAVVATPTAAPAPAAPAAEKPRYGGVIRVHSKEDPGILDLHQTVYARDLHALAPVYNLLVKTDARDASKIVPDLAERWEISPDGKTYTFYLRQGVKWHDGQPLTSADAKASFERIATPPKGVFSPRASYYKGIDKIETPDGNTVKFTLKYPQSSFLMMATVGFSVILPKHVLDKKGDMKKDVVGTGPFVFTEQMRGSHFLTEKNPSYFKPGLPYLDGIMRYVIPDSGAVEAALRTGRLDLTLDWHYVPDPGTRQKIVREMPGMTDQSVPVFSLRGLIINVKKGPWADVRVRKAAFLAVDKAEHGRVLMRGDEVVGGFMPPESGWEVPWAELKDRPGFRKPTAEDVAQAKKLLAEAGYPSGFKTNMMVRGTKEYQDDAVAAKFELAKIGIDANLEMVESTAFLNRREAREFEFMSYGVVSVEAGDPDLVLSRFLSNSPANYGNYNGPKFDEVYDKQTQAGDAAERKKLVLELQRILSEDLPVIPFWWRNYSAMAAPRVKGYINSVGLYSNFDLEDVWLAQ